MSAKKRSRPGPKGKKGDSSWSCLSGHVERWILEWKRGQDYTSSGSRNLCLADGAESLEGARRQAACFGRDEPARVYRGFRLVAIHEGKWRGDALLQDDNRERRT